MKKIRIKIGKLFTAIEEYEGKTLQLGEGYIPKLNFKISDKRGEFQKVPAIIKKVDIHCKIFFEDGTDVTVGKFHKICTNLETGECKFVGDLVSGETIQTRERTVKQIREIREGKTGEVYDIQIDVDDHLYSTPDGIVHHNTLVAVQTALDLLFTHQIEKIVITRPTVAKEDIGFLPGDIREKMDPWLAPIYHNLYMLYDKTKIDKEVEEGRIEIVPFAFIRGRTFVNSFVIVDEAQNVTGIQMEAVIGRLGKGSKMAICGDTAQIDLKSKKESGFSFLTTIAAEVSGVKLITLEANHRHEIVAPILEVYKRFGD